MMDPESHETSFVLKMSGHVMPKQVGWLNEFDGALEKRYGEDEGEVSKWAHRLS